MTRVSFEKLPDNILKVIKSIGAHADKRGVSAYLVGGIVRDLILGKESFDIDIVLEINAIDFAKTFAEESGASFVAYPKFMTATVSQDSGVRIDFATARKEKYSSPGALPDVSPATIQADLFRRDFTINAIAALMNKKKFGEIIDFYDGQGDLEKKKIRVFHDQSFIEDPTRILRAIRFEQRFNFEIETDTKKFLKGALKKNIIHNVTPGRYLEEFKKICEEQSPVKCLKRLFHLKILKEIFPDFCLDENRLKLLESIEAYFSSLNLQSFLGSRWLVYFMVFVDDVSLDDTKNLLNKFFVARKDQQKVLSSKTEYDVVKRLSCEKVSVDQANRVLKSLSKEELVFFYCKSDDDSVKEYINRFLN